MLNEWSGKIIQFPAPLTMTHDPLYCVVLQNWLDGEDGKSQMSLIIPLVEANGRKPNANEMAFRGYIALGWSVRSCYNQQLEAGTVVGEVEVNSMEFKKLHMLKTYTISGEGSQVDIGVGTEFDYAWQAQNLEAWAGFQEDTFKVDNKIYGTDI